MFAEEKVDTSSDIAEQSLTNIQAWLPEFMRPYWNSLLEHPWLLTIGVLVVGYLLAKIVQWGYRSIWHLVTSKTTNEYDDKLVLFSSQFIFNVIFYGSMLFAVEAFQFEQSMDTTLKRLIMTTFLFALMFIMLKSGKLALQALSDNKNRFKFIEERTIPILNIVTQIFIIGTISYLLIMLWGKDPSAWLASAGVMGIAIGFAAKDTLANLFAGFFIVADSPYKLGDYVRLDSGERGKVTHVGIRSTRLLTRDDVEVTVPNAVMGNAKIVNESGGPWEKTRIRVGVGVSYDSDLEHVCAVLQDVAENLSYVSTSPLPRVRAKLFGASSVDLQVQAWIEQPEIAGRVRHNLILAIHKRFKEEGVEIPYSKQDLYIKELPSSETEG